MRVNLPRRKCLWARKNGCSWTSCLTTKCVLRPFRYEALPRDKIQVGIHESLTGKSADMIIFDDPFDESEVRTKGER